MRMPLMELCDCCETPSPIQLAAQKVWGRTVQAPTDPLRDQLRSMIAVWDLYKSRTDPRRDRLYLIDCCVGNYSDPEMTHEGINRLHVDCCKASIQIPRASLISLRVGGFFCPRGTHRSFGAGTHTSPYHIVAWVIHLLSEPFIRRDCPWALLLENTE